MKIWLDTISKTSIPHDDCCDGRDCTPDQSYQGTRLPFSDALNQFSVTTLFQQATPLYRQQFTTGYWLACNTTDTGRITVLDEEANDLLDRFKYARTPYDVQTAMPGVDPESLLRAVHLLYQSGLLLANSPITSTLQVSTGGTLTAWLHITNACNLGCSYCYIDKSAEHMAEDTAFRSIDAIIRSATRQNFQGIRLKYAGGEASLHMARVIAVHDYALQQTAQHGLNLKATLLTNGVVLSQRAIDNLKQRQINISISLDGVGAFHDSQRPFKHGQPSFKYVNATIERLMANNIAPHIMVTVSQRNLAGLDDLLTYILERELSFSLSYYRDNEHALEHEQLQFDEQHMIKAMLAAFKIIERRLPRRSLLQAIVDKANLAYTHERTCGVGQNYLVIDQHGQVAKCHADIKRTITTIDAPDPLQLLRVDRRGVQNLSVDEKEGCRTCDWRYWCGGGCPLLTYRVTHRYNIKSPNCHIYQALFPAALRLEALRLLKYEAPQVFA